MVGGAFETLRCAKSKHGLPTKTPVLLSVFFSYSNKNLRNCQYSIFAKKKKNVAPEYSQCFSSSNRDALLTVTLACRKKKDTGGGESSAGGFEKVDDPTLGDDFSESGVGGAGMI